MTTAQRRTLLFEPLGVVMFRDHRPFDAGQHVLARSQYPLPSVFRGAVRTALFNAAGADFRKPRFGLDGVEHELLGDAGQPERFRLSSGLFVRHTQANRYEYLLPWPRDLFVGKHALRDDHPHRRVMARVLQPDEREGALRSTSLRLGPSHDEGARALEPLDVALPWTRESLDKPTKKRLWLTPSGAKQYATCPGDSLDLVEHEHWVDQHGFLADEERLGIARATMNENRFVAAESMLYILVTWRLEAGFCFGVEFDVSGLDADQQRVAETLLQRIDGSLQRLGGQSQHARVTVLEGSLGPDLEIPANDGPAKLWLWSPGLFDPAVLTERFGMRGALGKSIRVGGFDMAKHAPRPLVSALDKGSVLWFPRSRPAHVSEYHSDYAKLNDVSEQGYGHGIWIPTTATNASES